MTLSEESELEVLPYFWYPVYNGDLKLYVKQINFVLKIDSKT